MNNYIQLWGFLSRRPVVATVVVLVLVLVAAAIAVLGFIAALLLPLSSSG